MVRKKQINILPLAVTKYFFVAVVVIGLSVFIYNRLYGLVINCGYFTVKTIIIEPSLRFIDRRDLEKLRGKSMFKVDLKETHRILARKYPQVSDLRIIRRFPNQIHIQARKRLPFVQFKVKNKTLTLDDQGIVLSSTSKQSQKLPFVLGAYNEKQYSLGFPLPGREVQVALDVIKSFQDNQTLSSYRISEVDVENLSKIQFYLSNKLTVILDTDQIDHKMKILAVALSQGKIDPDKDKYIDLRFKDLIIGKK